MFAGFVALEGTMAFPVLVTTGNPPVPVASSSTPTYRVYGNAGLLANVTGSLTTKETGSITGATNASPIVITSTSHGLTTGMSVTISGVLGNTAANGTFVITRIDANTFSLNSSTGNGAYTSGGTWVTTGFYQCSFVASAANGFAQGEWYDVLVVATVSGNAVEYAYRFGVI